MPRDSQEYPQWREMDLAPKQLPPATRADLDALPPAWRGEIPLDQSFNWEGTLITPANIALN